MTRTWSVDSLRPQPRTYRARTLREALALVRRELGGEAVILGTREVKRRRLLGLGRRELIEVTASPPSGAAPPAEAAGVAHELRQQFDEQLGRLHAMVESLSHQGRLDHLLPDLPAAL